jgi:hypothetical protein
MAMTEVPDSDPPRLDDPFYPEGVERVKAAVVQLQRKGIVDAEGRRIRQDLPPDMRLDSEREFGG